MFLAWQIDSGPRSLDAHLTSSAANNHKGCTAPVIQRARIFKRLDGTGPNTRNALHDVPALRARPTGRQAPRRPPLGRGKLIDAAIRRGDFSAVSSLPSMMRATLPLRSCDKGTLEAKQRDQGKGGGAQAQHSTNSIAASIQVISRQTPALARLAGHKRSESRASARVFRPGDGIGYKTLSSRRRPGPKFRKHTTTETTAPPPLVIR